MANSPYAFILLKNKTQTITSTDPTLDKFFFVFLTQLNDTIKYCGLRLSLERRPMGAYSGREGAMQRAAYRPEWLPLSFQVLY